MTNQAEQSLEDCINSGTVSNPEWAERYLDDEFQLVYMYPIRRVVDRASWLRTIPNFRLDEWTVKNELLTIRGNTAIHNRLVFMRSEVRGVVRDGEFSCADCWIFHPGQGWRLWQRFSTPLTSVALPE